MGCRLVACSTLAVSSVVVDLSQHRFIIPTKPIDRA